MKLKIVVLDLSVPPEARRAALLALLVVGLAAAVPYTFSSGDILSSKAVNANFADVDAHIASGRFVFINDAGVSYSTGFTRYCGAATGGTGSITSGAKSGYSAAKAQCETVPGCSASAHMCSSEEVIRTAQMGVVSAQGWISTGVTNAMTGGLDDCNGWKTGDGTQNGVVWTGTFPGWVGCNTAEAILCCD